MFCLNCGKELEDGMQFCPSCGRRVDFSEERCKRAGVLENFQKALTASQHGQKAEETRADRRRSRNGILGGVIFQIMQRAEKSEPEK